MFKKEQILKEFYRTLLNDDEQVIDNSSSAIALKLNVNKQYVDVIVSESLRIKTNTLNETKDVIVKRVTSSKYMGVSYDKKRNKFRAQIALPGDVKKYLGLFLTEIDAHVAYLNYRSKNININEIEVNFELVIPLNKRNDLGQFIKTLN